MSIGNTASAFIGPAYIALVAALVGMAALMYACDAIAGLIVKRKRRSKPGE